MIVVVASEPAPWLGPLLARLERPLLLAPWALPVRLPGRFLGRRYQPGARWQPGWTALEAALALWSRGRTDRQMEARFQLRALTDLWASRALPARVEQVYAPSCAAWRTFARARKRGAETILVEDLPSLRELQDDLDRAAARHPECRFLRRYRADRPRLVRQESERALSHRLLLRGSHARALRGRGEPLPVAPAGSFRTCPGRLCLAGLATGRNGSNEALALLERLPHFELEVQAGEGLEPAGLLSHPRVRARQGLPTGELVLAPAWCESYSPEVEAALAAGVPVVGTRRGAGWSALSAEVEPGDLEALVAAVERLTGRRAEGRL